MIFSHNGNLSIQKDGTAVTAALNSYEQCSVENGIIKRNGTEINLRSGKNEKMSRVRKRKRKIDL